MSRHTRRGVGAIEFALTLPFLLLVVLGIVELSVLMHRTYVVSRVARDACRAGAQVIEGPTPTGELIEDAAFVEARFGLQAAGLPCGPETGDPENPCIVTAEWIPHDDWQVLVVDVRVPYHQITGLFPAFPEHSIGHFTMLTQQQIWE